MADEKDNKLNQDVAKMARSATDRINRTLIDHHNQCLIDGYSSTAAFASSLIAATHVAAQLCAKGILDGVTGSGDIAERVDRESALFKELLTNYCKIISLQESEHANKGHTGTGNPDSNSGAGNGASPTTN